MFGSPMGAREVVVQNSARGVLWEVGVGLVFLGDLPPVGLGVLSGLA